MFHDTSRFGSSVQELQAARTWRRQNLQTRTSRLERFHEGVASRERDFEQRARNGRARTRVERGGMLHPRETVTSIWFYCLSIRAEPTNASHGIAPIVAATSRAVIRRRPGVRSATSSPGGRRDPRRVDGDHVHRHAPRSGAAGCGGRRLGPRLRVEPVGSRRARGSSADRFAARSRCPLRTATIRLVSDRAGPRRLAAASGGGTMP